MKSDLIWHRPLRGVRKSETAKGSPWGNYGRPSTWEVVRETETPLWKTLKALKGMPFKGYF